MDGPVIHRILVEFEVRVEPEVGNGPWARQMEAQRARIALHRRLGRMRLSSPTGLVAHVELVSPTEEAVMQRARYAHRDRPADVATE